MPSSGDAFSLRRGSATPYFWRDQCDPEQLGGGTMLNVHTRYYDALWHVHTSTDRKREYYPDIIRQLAEAKGYKDNFTEAMLVRFLHGADAKRVCAHLEEE